MDWDSFLHSLAGKRVVLSGCGGGSDVLGTSVIYARIKDTAKEVSAGGRVPRVSGLVDRTSR